MRSIVYGLAVAILAGGALGADGDATAKAGPVPIIHRIADPVGGVVVIVGVTDGAATALLARKGRKFVCGTTRDLARATACRKDIEKEGLGHRASVIWRQTDHLPFADNLVNQVIVRKWGVGDAKGLSAAEVVRVLAPGGVGFLSGIDPSRADALVTELKKLPVKDVTKTGAGRRVRFVKARDVRFGEWAHGLGGPELNRVSTDRAVGPGVEVRWVNGPWWGDLYGSYRGGIIAGGRMFHNEKHWVRPGLSKWVTVARDAFNGCELWRADVEGAPRVGEALDMTMTADGERLYQREGRTLIARAAATGKVVKRYGFAPATVTIAGGRLVIFHGRRAEGRRPDGDKPIWTRPTSCAPAAAGGAAYVLNGKELEALNLSDGKTIWKRSLDALDVKPFKRTVMCKGDAVYAIQVLKKLGKQVIVAVDRADGRARWAHTVTSDYRGMPVLPFDDQFWLPVRTGVKKDNMMHTVLDARTGEQLKQFRATGYVQGRCWVPRATDRFVIYGNGWHVDRATLKVVYQAGIRSMCRHGQAPANGMEYYMPHMCDCKVIIRGFAGISSGSNLPAGKAKTDFVRHSPGALLLPGPAEDDWPTYRRDMARSNASATELPKTLRKLWSVRIGSGRVGQATAVGGTVYAVSPDSHRVVAIAAADGKKRWSFVADARVDTAPTIHKGLCLFGSRGGWVYCLDAATGKPLWQRRIAPNQKYMAAEGQVESSWPVIGGVMIGPPAKKGGAATAYVNAGRSGSMDGGVQLAALDPATGEVIWRHTRTGLSAADVLAGDGKRFQVRLREHSYATGRPTRTALKTPKGVLSCRGSWSGRATIADYVRTLEPGRTRNRKGALLDGRGHSGETLAFTADQAVTTWRYWKAWGFKEYDKANEGRFYMYAKGKHVWTKERTPQHFRATILTSDRVVAAGIAEFRDSGKPPELWTINLADGAELQKLPLPAAPTIDALSAADGKVFVGLTNGELTCFGK